MVVSVERSIVAVGRPPLGYVGSEERVEDDLGVVLASVVTIPWF